VLAVVAACWWKAARSSAELEWPFEHRDHCRVALLCSRVLRHDRAAQNCPDLHLELVTTVR
jgi:hypothetical protein